MDYNINERIRKILKEFYGGNITKMSLSTYIKRTTISSIVGEQEVSPGYETIGKIAEALSPRINLKWLITGEGDMTKETESKYPCAVSEIPYYAVDFMGGFDLVYNSKENTPDGVVRLPQFSKADCIVDVSGKSMEPLICSGDCIAIKRLENWRDTYLPGEVYAIVTREYRTIKRIRKSEKGPDWIKLVPENPDFDPMDLKIDSVMAVFLVLGAVKKIF